MGRSSSMPVARHGPLFSRPDIGPLYIHIRARILTLIIIPCQLQLLQRRAANTTSTCEAPLRNSAQGRLLDSYLPEADSSHEAPTSVGSSPSSLDGYQLLSMTPPPLFPGLTFPQRTSTPLYDSALPRPQHALASQDSG